jgi:hypothetical protein
MQLFYCLRLAAIRQSGADHSECGACR